MHQVNVRDAMIEYESNRLCIDILEYWIAEKPSNWSALGYFITVININPITDKRTAHVNISQDLDNLYTAFIDDGVTKRIVYNIRQSMESKNGREVINEFWEMHANTLQSLLLQNETSQATVLSLMMKNASSSSAADNSVTTASSSAPSKRNSQSQRETRRQKRLIEQLNTVAESDNVFVSEQTASVGTVTKREAIEIHEKLLSKEALTARQRKIMTNSLSSILDLADNSLASQRSLFNELQWSELQLLFDDRLKVDPVVLSEKVKDIIMIVSGTLGLSGDYECCISLVKKEIKRSRCDTTIAALAILKAILKRVLLLEPSKNTP